MTQEELNALRDAVRQEFMLLYAEKIREEIKQEFAELRAEAAQAACEILDTAGSAEFLHITKAHLYKLVCKKQIPYYKSAGGKLTYFKRAELAQWLTAVRVPTNDELQAQAAMRCAKKGGEV